MQPKIFSDPRGRFQSYDRFGWRRNPVGRKIWGEVQPEKLIALKGFRKRIIPKWYCNQATLWLWALSREWPDGSGGGGGGWMTSRTLEGQA